MFYIKTEIKDHKFLTTLNCLKIEVWTFLLYVAGLVVDLHCFVLTFIRLKFGYFG